jgi:hypothetical protein
MFHGKRHLDEMSKSEIEAFLTHLAVKRNVAASRQSQAFSALFFLYRELLNRETPWQDDVTRVKIPQ